MTRTFSSRMPLLLSKFVDSMGYNALIGGLALLNWAFPDLYTPCIILSLCTFLALASRDGKGFFILAIIPIIVTSKEVTFSNLPINMIVPIASVILCMIIYLIMKRPAFHINKLCIPWICLALVMSLSLLINVFATKTEKIYMNAFFYVLYFFLLIFFSTLVTCITYEGDSLLGLSKAMAIFGLIIAAQVFIFFFIQNPEKMGDRGACTLGWANNANVVSMFLIITIPFYGVLAYKGYWYYFFPVAIVAFADMMLASRCGYLCLTISIAPLIVMSFRNYKSRSYIYLTLFTLFIGFLFAMLLLFPDWFRKIIEAFEYIGFDDNGRDPLYKYGIEQFKSNPLLGTSANCLFFYNNSNGNINLLHNTFITYMASSGILGLLCLAAYYLMAYGYLIFVCKDKSRFHIILFFVLVDIIGLVDNGIVDPLFVYLVLITFSTMKKTPRTEDICTINQNYFEHYRAIAK